MLKAYLSVICASLILADMRGYHAQLSMVASDIDMISVILIKGKLLKLHAPMSIHAMSISAVEENSAEEDREEEDMEQEENEEDLEQVKVPPKCDICRSARLQMQSANPPSSYEPLARTQKQPGGNASRLRPLRTRANLVEVVSVSNLLEVNH